MTEQPKQQIAIVGSVAYDQISTTDALIAERKGPLLNCKLSSLNEVFGGCGGNIAYNLAALGNNPVLATCSGMADDERYLAQCDDLGIQTHGFLRTPETHCARAIIMTDPHGKQFTAFFPGPVPGPEQWHEHLASINLAASTVFLAAPYPPALMQVSLEHASNLGHAPLKIWCPGQYADQLNNEQIRTLTGLSDWIVGNAHEIAHLQRAPGVLASKLVITTDGERPVTITYPDASTSVHAVAAIDGVKDPTGCGDAFLAAVAHCVAAASQSRWQDLLPDAIAAGNKAAAACLAQTGGQRHRPNGHHHGDRF